MKPLRDPLLAATLFLSTLVFIPYIAGLDTQIRKPTVHTENELVTDNPGNSYDFPASYDQTSFASTDDPTSDPSITFEGWNTSRKKDYLDLSLEVTVESANFSDQEWGVYYDNTSDTSCDSTDNVLKSRGNDNVPLTNYSAQLPESQDLSNLQVCISGFGTLPLDGAVVNTSDIRTEGTVNHQPVIESTRSFNASDYGSLREQSDLLRSEDAVFHANISDPEGTVLQYANISIANSTGYRKENVSMTNISALSFEKGALFEYNYSFPSNGDIGQWSFEVFTRDSGDLEKLSSSTFDVYVNSYLNLSRSPREKLLNRSEEFTFSGDVSCWGHQDAECGNVKASLQYRNYTEQDWKLVPEGSGNFLHVGTNTRDCSGLNFTDTCFRNWQVNATADGGFRLRANVSAGESWVERNESRENRLYVDSYELNLTLENSSGKVYDGAKLSVFDSQGSLVDSTVLGQDRFLEVPARELENSSFSMGAPVYDSFIDVEVNDFNMTENTFRDSQVVKNYTGSLPENVVEIKTVYAFNDTGLDISYANLTMPKHGTRVDVILHCTDWNYGSGSCAQGSWQVNDTSDYQSGENATHFWFRVNSFDAFGTGTGEPLPNVTELEIYNVTGMSQQQKETGGMLLGSGLNRTFQVGQLENPRTYRFTFRIRNDGTQDWSIESSDTLFHDGLNSTWSVGKTWYNISGTEFVGGTFSSRKLSWDTSQGGVLDKQDGNDTMYAKYLVNVSEDRSRLYRQQFLVNDTSDNAGSQDLHNFNITKYGFLDVVLEEPPDETIVAQNETFLVNATIFCREGKCGDVNVSTRYNKSSAADTLIPENSGEPFHTNNSNTGSCGTSLTTGDTCFGSWEVNATGPLDSTHLLDVNASSSLGFVENNDSVDHQATITEGAILIDVKWDVLDFGVIDPGKANQSALGNDNHKYNVTVEENSIEVDDLWVKMDDLTTGGYGDYFIPAENASYGLKNDVNNESGLSNSYQRIASGIRPGTNFTTFYWLDVPEGIKSAKYNGTIYFKANGTA